MLGDGQGHAVHLGERDCSLQRRNQKVWEEGPSPALNAEQREEIGGVVARAVAELGYVGAGRMGASGSLVLSLERSRISPVFSIRMHMLLKPLVAMPRICSG